MALLLKVKQPGECASCSAVEAESPGPVFFFFFRPEPVGRGLVVVPFVFFTIYKFRNGW